MKCEYCERKFDNLINVDGDSLCQECVENNPDIYYCSDCQEWHYSDNMYYVNGIDDYVCEDCINNGNYFQCHDCGDYFHIDESNDCYGGNYCVCDRCRDDHYTYVDCCGTYIDSDNTYYSEEDNCYYCEEHYHEDIYDYHGFNDWEKHTLENENPPFCIGFELEVENIKHRYDNNELARFVKDTCPVICSRDSSIDDGFEIVSHPLSYNYIVENQDKLKYTLEELSTRGCESHNPGTCGLHFHVTHPHNDDIIDRMILIMETYKQELITFSRRTSSQIQDWCKFLSDIKNGEDCKSLYFIKKNKNTSTRYMALNLTNYNTIEFRIFRGTLNFDTFMASVELVNNIVTLCSDLSIPVEEITWDRLTETKYAHTYCDMKNIRSTTIPHSNDEEYIALEVKTEKYKKLVKKEFNENVFSIIKNYIVDLFTNTEEFVGLDTNVQYISGSLNIKDIVYYCKRVVNECNFSTSTIENIKNDINNVLQVMQYSNISMGNLTDKLNVLLKESE